MMLLSPLNQDALQAVGLRGLSLTASLLHPILQLVCLHGLPPGFDSRDARHLQTRKDGNLQYAG